MRSETYLGYRTRLKAKGAARYKTYTSLRHKAKCTTKNERKHSAKGAAGSEGHYICRCGCTHKYTQNMHATSLLRGLSSRAAQSLSFPVGAHVVFDGLLVSVFKQTEFQTISAYYGVLEC